MRNSILAAILLALWCAPTASGAPPDAKEILAKAKQAMGGEKWNAIESSHTILKISTGGLKGTAEAWDNVRQAHYLDTFQLGPLSGAQGFDGKTVWSLDSSKQARVEEGGDAREAAINDAFRRSFAFWFPERWEATVEFSGEQQEEGKRLYVLRFTPKGGRPFDLWINAETYLFDRTVEKGALETRTNYYSDYRDVNGVKVPFAGRSTNGDARYDQFSAIEKLEFNVPVEEARFRMPQPPPPDFRFAAGKTSTTVPFELLNNHIYVPVKLNGKGPFRLLCDTGGVNIVTPEVAKELGLKSEGALEGRGVGEKSENVALSKLQSVEVGDATISDQVFAVFPMGALAAAEGVPQSGLIGYEVFKRFVVRVDYERSLLTLTLPSAFHYQGTGTRVPFKFNQHVPQVEGEIDGLPGKFDIDTGSRASLSLLAPFAEKNDLSARYGAKVEAVTGWGVGGAARSRVTRARMLRLGGMEVTSPITELSLQKRGGFTDPYVAGNVGGGVLKRFNITFDYAQQQLILERNANYDKPDTFDRSGMWINAAGDAFEVLDVVPGGPAADAGLHVGDRILAIDGRNAKEISLPAARVRFKTDPPGTQVHLTVRSGEKQRDAVLTLKDLV